MSIKSLSQSSLTNFQKYSSLLAGNRAFTPNGYDLLQTEILTGTTTSISFSSLVSSYSDTYKHLQIRGVARSTRASSTADFAKITFNSDTTGYARHAIYGPAAATYGLTDIIGTPDFPAASSGAGQYGVFIIDILEPFNTSKNTTIRGLGGAAGDPYQVMIKSGLWVDTSAVDIIKFESGNAAAFAQYSRLSLYGFRG